MTRTPLSRKSGLSLVEILMAIAVMAFGLGGIMTLYVQSQKNADLSHRRTAAEFLVSRKAQELKAAGYETLLSYMKKSQQAGAPHKVLIPDPPAKTPLGSAAAQGGLAECVWQAELEQFGGPAGCVEVRVWAKWPAQGALGDGAHMRETATALYVFE
jgi:Tfp pilus assembly protein PilW